MALEGCSVQNLGVPWPRGSVCVGWCPPWSGVALVPARGGREPERGPVKPVASALQLETLFRSQVCRSFLDSVRAFDFSVPLPGVELSCAHPTADLTFRLKSEMMLQTTAAVKFKPGTAISSRLGCGAGQQPWLSADAWSSVFSVLARHRHSKSWRGHPQVCALWAIWVRGAPSPWKKFGGITPSVVSGKKEKNHPTLDRLEYIYRLYFSSIVILFFFSYSSDHSENTFPSNSFIFHIAYIHTMSSISDLPSLRWGIIGMSPST